MPSPYNAARVAVDAETWQLFRRAALARGIPVSVYLGKLVQREVGRRQETPAAGVDPGQPEADQSLAALGAVRASIDDLDNIAGRLARTAVAHGGAWEDVGSRLGMSAEGVRVAYERPGRGSLR